MNDSHGRMIPMRKTCLFSLSFSVTCSFCLFVRFLLAGDGGYRVANLSALKVLKLVYLSIVSMLYED